MPCQLQMGFLPTDHSGVPSTLVLPTMMPWSQGGSEHNMVCRLGKSELRRNVKALTGGQSFKGKSGRNWAPVTLPTRSVSQLERPGSASPRFLIIIPTSVHSLGSDPSVYPMRLGTRLFLFLTERKEKVLADDLQVTGTP